MIRDQNTSGAKSVKVTLSFRVPQGSVLRLIPFTQYTCPLGQICAHHNVLYHLYADDQQIYLSFRLGPPNSSKELHTNCTTRIEKCIAEITSWMNTNMLKINDNKMEFSIFGMWQQLSKISNITIAIDNESVTPVEYVRNLGFIMNLFLKNNHHITKVLSILSYQVRNVYQIHVRLDLETAKLVVQALVMSKLDYCNSLLAVTPECYCTKVQHIQNMACWVVCNLHKFDHVND